MTSYHRKRFLDPAILDEAVREVAQAAKNENVRIAVIGGYAMQVYGSDRLTGDVDFAADDLIRAFPPGPELSFGGVQTETSSGVPIDLVLRSDVYQPLYQDAIEKAKRVKGIPVLVARAEHLAAMKMAAGRSGKDDADLDFLIVSGVLDVDKARRIIAKYLGVYGAESFDRIVELARWQRGRGR